MAALLKDYILKKIIQLTQYDQWNIGIVDSPIHSFLNPDFEPHIEWLPVPGDGCFRADPFGMEKDGKLYVFFEDFSYKTNKGRLSYLRLDGSIPPHGGKVTLNSSLHMSYPYLVREAGEVYCIPETAGNSEICIYRASAFPERWEAVCKVVENFAANDPTAFYHEDRWWMACSLLGGWDQLYLWYAPGLLGPWSAHTANPVKVDIRSSRPAGTPFFHQGALYRPAQDCSRTYGGQIVINRILELSPHRFREEAVAVVKPDRLGLYPHGTHTLAALGHITLVDGKRRVFSLAGSIQTLLRKIKNAV